MEKCLNPTELRQALARGYCDDENAHKILDPELIESMALEIEKLDRPTEAKKNFDIVSEKYNKDKSYRPYCCGCRTMNRMKLKGDVFICENCGSQHLITDSSIDHVWIEGVVEAFKKEFNCANFTWTFALDGEKQMDRVIDWLRKTLAEKKG